MACGKPPDPDKITPPRPPGHPLTQPTLAALRQVEDTIARKGPSRDVDESMAWAQRLLSRAIAHGVRGAELKRLEARFDQLTGFAQSRLRDNVPAPASIRSAHTKSVPGDWVMRNFSEAAARRNAPTVIRALETDQHWRSRAYKDQILRMVEGNSRIPREYQNQLPKDVARVLRACPSAAGIVKAMTLRGQRTPLASRAKLRSDSNSAIGSAYELMGTAELTRSVSKSVNGGPPLYVDVGIDVVTFGAKSVINTQLSRWGMISPPSRRTVESDLRIGRPTLTRYKEIGVDFKHGKDARPRYASADLRSQVENVVRAIQHGDMDEFHFVTNGTFGTSFREVIDRANDTLRETRATAISLHEHVTSVR